MVNVCVTRQQHNELSPWYAALVWYPASALPFVPSSAPYVLLVQLPMGSGEWERLALTYAFSAGW